MQNSFNKLYKDVETNIDTNINKIKKITNKMIFGFINTYSDNDICFNRYTINDSDMNKIVSYTGNTKNFYIEYITQYTKNINWKNINDPYNLVLLFVLKYFIVQNNNKEANKITILITIKLFTGLLYKYFPSGCSSSVMDYTINNFNKKFLLGRNNGKIIKVIKDISDSHSAVYNLNYIKY